MILIGTDDNNVPTANSLVIAGKIPGAWLVQIKDACHELFVQYPDKVNKVLQTFLSSTTTMTIPPPTWWNITLIKWNLPGWYKDKFLRYKQSITT